MSPDSDCAGYDVTRRVVVPGIPHASFMSGPPRRAVFRDWLRLGPRSALVGRVTYLAPGYSSALA
jgi:hypothetical protein